MAACLARGETILKNCAKEPEVVDLVPEGFAMVETDLFPKLARMNKLAGYPFEGRWYDLGTFERYEKAIKELKNM